MYCMMDLLIFFLFDVFAVQHAYCSGIQLTAPTYNATVGKNYTLLCEATTSVNAVSFRKKNQEICLIIIGYCVCDGNEQLVNYKLKCESNKYELTIAESIVNTMHGSVWNCTDPYGASFSEKKKIFVNVPISSVSITPISAGVAVYSNQMFTCTTDAGRPSAMIRWYLSDGTDLTGSASQQPDCGLCINPVESSSNVTYIGNLTDHGKTIYCVASNYEENTKKSQNALIEILYKPDSVVLSPPTSSYKVDETAGSVGPITCTAVCRPNCTMTWSGPYLPSGPAPKLSLNNINRTQAGSYYCTASNNVGSKNSTKVTIIVNYRPYSVSIFPTTQSYTVTETTGSVGPITCTADCRPGCTVTWSGPNLSSSSTPELMIQNITKKQNGRYNCTASNRLGSMMSETVNVFVNYGPSSVVITPPYTNYIVTETTGNIGPITCTAECRPDCRMTWSGPNLRVTTSDLMLKNISKNQAGSYQCTASNGIGSKNSTKVTVIVNYGPYAVSLTPITLSYVVTESKDSIGPIICTADCRPACTLTWTGPNIPGGTHSQLALSNITRNQAGLYSCTASNTIGSLMSEKVNVSVNYGPSALVITPSNMTYIVTETIGSIGPITCTADCRPHCTMIWSGPNLPVTTSDLMLNNINKNQAGSYECTAINSVGSRNSTKVTITVYYTPTVLSIEGNSTYSENDTAEFRCNVDSIPKSSVKWKLLDIHSTKQLPDDNDPTYKINGSFLKVSPINCLSMGVYRCEANNGIGKDQMDLNVTVMCAPRLNTIECDIQHQVAIRDNQSLTITAPVLAYPKPRIYWKFFQNDSGININMGIINTFKINRHISTLFIQNMTQNDFGIYAIYAVNRIGNNSNYIGTYDVQSARRPNKPSNVTCVPGPNYIIVNWQPEFHGGSPQSFRVLYRTIQDKSFIGHKDNVSEADYHPVRIMNLQSSSAYLLKVHAENIYNITLTDEVYCNTTSEGYAKSKIIIGVSEGAGIGLAVVAICLAFALLFIFRRLQTKNQKNDTESMKRSNEDEENDDLKDNPLYVSSVDDVVHQSDVYSQVSKEKNQDTYSTNPKKKKKKDKSDKLIELGCVYENFEEITKGNEHIHANQQYAKDNTLKYNPRKNKDGLIYADLDLAPVSEGQRFVIRGMDNRNNYAIIDLSKKADPLPSDDEDKTEESKDRKH